MCNKHGSLKFLNIYKIFRYFRRLQQKSLFRLNFYVSLHFIAIHIKYTPGFFYINRNKMSETLYKFTDIIIP